MQVRHYMSELQVKHDTGQSTHMFPTASAKVDYTGQVARHRFRYSGKPLSHEVEYVALRQVLACA